MSANISIISGIIAICLLAGCNTIEAPRTDSAALSFTSVMGEPDPAPQTIRVGTSLFWHATTAVNWIVVSPDSGLASAAIAISVRPLLLVGDITDTVRIVSAGGTVEIPVHLHRTGRPARGLLYGMPNPPGSKYDSIVVAGPDGTGARGITFSLPPSQFRSSIRPWAYAVFDPSGERLAFAGFLDSNAQPNDCVFTSKADGVDADTPWCAFYAPGGVCRSLFGSVTWSPDGLELAGACLYTGETRLVIDSLARRRSTSVPLPASGLVAWSPDGTWILSGNGLVSPDRIRRDTVLHVPNGLQGIGWTPDNRIILGPSGGCGAGVQTIALGAALARDATPTPLLRAEYSYATFSPDGKKLLAVRCAPSYVVELMDANGTNVTWTMPGANWAAWRP